MVWTEKYANSRSSQAWIVEYYGHSFTRFEFNLLKILHGLIEDQQVSALSVSSAAIKKDAESLGSHGPTTG